MKKILAFISALLLASQAIASTPVARQYDFTDDRDNGIPILSARVDAELDQDITKLNQKMVIQPSAPSAPIPGMYWVDSTNKLLKEYRNSEWVIHGAVHIGSSAPATPQSGDLWVDTGTAYTLKVYNGVGWIRASEDLASPSIGIGTTTPVAGKFTTLLTTGNMGIGTTLISDGRLIVRGGNVGIGTDHPGFDLDVSGTIRATSFLGLSWTPSNIQTFTSGGTWTKPAGITKVYVKVWGAGGGGGFTTTNGGAGGGGAGAYVEGFTNVSGNVTVTVGTGGVGGTSLGNATAGGLSSFVASSTFTANGGAVGGDNSPGTGGSGGTASGGQINISGGSGGVGKGTSSSTANIGGTGGSAYGSGVGGEGGFANNSSSTPGNNGGLYGAGGGGCGKVGSNQGAAANGADGFVIVYY